MINQDEFNPRVEVQPDRRSTREKKRKLPIITGIILVSVFLLCFVPLHLAGQEEKPEEAETQQETQKSEESVNCEPSL